MTTVVFRTELGFDQYEIGNVNHFTLPALATEVFEFANITSGDPYQVIADVYDRTGFEHLLHHAILGETQYFWPTDDVSGTGLDGVDLAPGLDELMTQVTYEVKFEAIRQDEIPIFIHTGNVMADGSAGAGLEIRYDLYAEPTVEYTYKEHVPKKFVTSVIRGTVNDEYVTRYYLADLDTLIAYDLFYSLQVRLKDSDDEWIYLQSHELIAENVVTVDPGFRVEIADPVSSVRSCTFVRRAVDHYHNRHLRYHIQERHPSELYESF